VWQIAAAWSPSGCSTWQRCGAAGKPSWHGSSLRFWLSSDSLRPGAQYLVMTRGPKHLHEVCSLSVVVLACRLASWVSRGLAKPADCECTPERLLSTLFYSISFCTVGEATGAMCYLQKDLCITALGYHSISTSAEGHQQNARSPHQMLSPIRSDQLLQSVLQTSATPQQPRSLKLRHLIGTSMTSAHFGATVAC
jgi:hypothetical protein